MFTRSELELLKQSLQKDPAVLASDTAVLSRLVAQAEYSLDCAQLLEEAVRFPAEPYGEAAKLVATITDGFNEIWNRHHYRGRGGD